MKLLLCVCSLVALMACSDHQTAGTTSETENELSVRILMPDGTPAIQARVTLVDASHFDSLIAKGISPQLDSALTDSLGRVQLTSPSAVLRQNIVAHLPGFASIHKDISLSGHDSTLILDSAGSLLGHSDAPAGTWIYVDGTPYSTQVDSLGNYTFPNLPQGTFALLLQNNTIPLSLVGASNITVNISNIVTNMPDGLLLEDFDDGDAFPLINALGAGAAWYVYNDLAGTTFSPAGLDSQITLAISTNGAWQGNSLGLSILLDSSATTPYGSLACKLGPKGGLGRADLRDLDSISLWIKGSGTVRLFFASDYIHTKYSSTEAGNDLGYAFALPSAWTRITIPVDSLLPPTGSQPSSDGVTWSMVASAIDLFVLGSWDNAGQTVSFQIDDIRLYGVSHTIFR